MAVGETMMVGTLNKVEHSYINYGLSMILKAY